MSECRSCGAEIVWVVTDSGCRAGSSRHDAATDAKVCTPGVAVLWPVLWPVLWFTQLPTAEKPRASPSASSAPARLSWSVVVGPRGERWSVQASPSQ